MLHIVKQYYFKLFKKYFGTTIIEVYSEYMYDDISIYIVHDLDYISLKSGSYESLLKEYKLEIF